MAENPIRNPHSSSLSQHQTIILRRAIAGGRMATLTYARKSVQSRFWKNLDQTIKIMVDRGLILLVNEDKIVPTTWGREVYRISQERAAYWGYGRY